MCDVDPIRRELLKLSLLGAPLLAAACARSPAVSPLDPSEGRLHARPENPRASAAVASSQPEPLDLGNSRDGFFYVPPRRAAAGAPLLLYLHGASGSGRRAILPWLEQANRTGTIVVAPDSRGSTWGMVNGDEEPDLAFLDDALEKIFAAYRVDAHRIAVAGFSDGASAALSMGLVNGDLFSAIAAFSPGFIHLTGALQGRPRIYISHGREDSVLPIERCGGRIARELHEAGYPVTFTEFDGDHMVPPQIRTAAMDWLLKP